LLVASPVAAQSDANRAAARAAASQGADAEDAGNWAEAIELFTRAEALVHAPPHLLHIARAEAKRGRLVAAHEAYLKVTREELGGAAPRAFVEAQSAANEELSALTSRIPMLKITLAGGTGSVTIDNAPISDALVGIEFPIDPGHHELSARGKGRKSVPVSIDLAEGKHEAVRLVLEPSNEAAPAPIPTSDATPPTTAAPEHRSNAPAYIAWGVGAAGIVAGTAMMLVNHGKREDANALCPNGNCPMSKRSTIDELDASADQAATLSWIGYGVGVAGLGVGTVLFLMNRGEPSGPRAGVRPWFATNGAGVSGCF
jgi:hypothetical protein